MKRSRKPHGETRRSQRPGGKPPAPLSNAVRSGNLLSVSGITPFDSKGELAVG